MSQIVQITKRLTILDRKEIVKHIDDDDDDDQELDSITSKNYEAIKVDVEDGIYQAGDLVKIFRDILKRMNTGTHETGSSGVTHAHNFPLNDLHPESKYGITVDWEDLLTREDRE